MQKLVWIAVAGGLGSLARYGLSGLVQNALGKDFPWGTVTVNVLGCLVFGLLWSISVDRWPIHAETRTVILVGFMGAFTTFSTFIFETGQLARDAEWLAVLANIGIQNLVGLAALFAGLAAGRLI